MLMPDHDQLVLSLATKAEGLQSCNEWLVQGETAYVK